MIIRFGIIQSQSHKLKGRMAVSTTHYRIVTNLIVSFVVVDGGASFPFLWYLLYTINCFTNDTHNHTVKESKHNKISCDEIPLHSPANKTPFLCKFFREYYKKKVFGLLPNYWQLELKSPFLYYLVIHFFCLKSIHHIK